MIVEKEFTLLKVEQKKRITKEGKEQIYLVLNVLDEDFSPCKFFVFNEDKVKLILNDVQSAKALSKVLINFNLVYSNNIWNCNLNDAVFTY